MSKRDELSVIIPTHNYAEFLPQALDSVLCQGEPDTQIIVVDDGSTDDTAAVLGAYHGRIEIVRQSNQGIGAARHAGLVRARGSLVGFLDSDDQWTDNHCAVLRAALEADPHLDLVFGRVCEFADDESGCPLPTRPEAARDGLLIGAMLARRRVFERVGSFRSDLRAGEFVDWLGRARQLGVRSTMVEDVVLMRRIHARNTMRRADAAGGLTQALRDRLAAVRKSGAG